MIIAAAIRTEQDTYELPPPARHHDVMYEMVMRGHAVPITGEQGFIDDQRGFVTRWKAAQIALTQKQIKKLRWPPELYSEDLW